MTNTTINKIFDDLDNYRLFCRDYGFVFNEADLYNSNSHSYRQYQKHLSGKKVKSQWELDLARFKEKELGDITKNYF